MKSDFLLYWRPENAEYTDEAYEGKLLHAASKQFGRVSKGDRIWIVTCLDDVFYLLGPLDIDQIVGTRKAEKVLGRSDLYQADFHVLAAKGKAAKMKWIEVDDFLLTLRFDGTKKDRLPDDYNPQNLQTMRLLTTESGLLLDELYKKNK